MEMEYKDVTTDGNWKREVRRRNMFGWRCQKIRGMREVTHHAKISENTGGSYDVSYYDTEEKKTYISFQRERLSFIKTAVIYILEMVYRLTVVLLWPFIAALILSFVAHYVEIDLEMTMFKTVAIAFLIFIITKIVVFILSKKIPSALGYDVSEQV